MPLLNFRHRFAGVSSSEPSTRPTAGQGSSRVIVRELPVWGLVGLTLAYFYRPLTDETFFVRDLYVHFIPARRLLVDYIRARRWPLWDPYMLGGGPFLSDMTNLVLYPTSLLYFLIPWIWAFNWEIVLHFLWAGVGAYALARELGNGRRASFLAGIIYTFCGYTLSQANIYHRLIGMAHVPWVSLCWHRYLQTRRRLWFVLTTVTGTLQILGGAPEASLLTLLFVLGWSLTYPYINLSRRHRILQWLALGGCILGLASVQVGPTLEMFLSSERSRITPEGAEVYTVWSLHPKRLPEVVFPQFLGPTDIMREAGVDPYWGRLIEDRGFPYVLSIYLGLGSLILAGVGAMSYASRTSPSTLAVYLSGAFLISVLLSLGRFLPGFHLLAYVPLLRQFRYPIKFMMLGVLPIALLAARGWTVLWESENPPARLWRRTVGLVGVLTTALLIGWVAFDRWDALARRVQVFFFQELHPLAHSGLVRSGRHTLLIMTALTLTLLYRTFRPRPWQRALALVILSVDLLTAGWRVNSYAPREWLSYTPPSVEKVRRFLNDGKFYRFEGALFVSTPALIDTLDWHSIRSENLGRFTGVYYRLPTLRPGSFSGLEDYRWVRWLMAIQAVSRWDLRIPMLSVTGVTVFVTPEVVRHPGVERILETRRLFHVYGYYNQQAVPRVYFVTDWKSVASEENALTIITRPDFDPHRTVVVLGPGRPPPGNPTCPTPPEVHVRSRVFDRYQVEVSTPCEGYLVLAETFYSGWRVRVDGRPRPLLRANYVYSAVFLEAGRHRVEFWFWPRLLVPGCLGTLLTATALLVWARPSKGRQENPDPRNQMSTKQ